MALTSPFDFTGLPMRVRFMDAKADPKSGKREVGFQITVPTAAVGVENGGVRRVRLEFVGLARTTAGEDATSFNFNADTEIKTGSTAQPAPRDLTANGNLELGPGEYSVRMVVRDNLTGQTGSVQAPVIVR